LQGLLQPWRHVYTLDQLLSAETLLEFGCAYAHLRDIDIAEADWKLWGGYGE